MKKFLFLVVMIAAVLAFQNVFAEEVVFSTEDFSITRLDDGRYAGSDGLEYFLFESEFDLESESLRAWDSCPVKGGGGITAKVCTDRISGTQLKVKVKVETFPQGAINVYAYPCYVISGTNSIQGCDPYNRGYYPNYSGDSYFSVSNSYGFVGGFRGWYSFGKRIR